MADLAEHRVLVCGGREYTNVRHVFDVLDALDPRPTLIIQGGAFGADACASEWAWKRKVPEKEFRANWAKHGRAAGPIRNQRMIDEGRPNLVVAFPGGTGTADMVRRAEAAGIPVVRA